MGDHVVLEGATNFRDLGGYATTSGQMTKPGKIFRSDALHRLTDNDHRRVSELGLRLVCDLRYGEEREREPSRLPDTVEVLHVGLATRPDESFADSLDVEQRTEANALTYLTENYRQYPHLYAGAYRTILKRLSDLEDGSMVIHCTAGKDRAGTAAAMFLLTLGVSYETVLEDYLKTNLYWDRGDRPPGDWPRDVVEAIFTARAEYLNAALGVIDTEFGSFASYLSEIVGFSAAEQSALKARMLE